MFIECSLNIPSMFPEFSFLQVSFAARFAPMPQAGPDWVQKVHWPCAVHDAVYVLTRMLPNAERHWLAFLAVLAFAGVVVGATYVGNILNR
jgi:hypothetical protein